MSYEEFLEGIGRMADIISLPIIGDEKISI